MRTAGLLAVLLSCCTLEGLSVQAQVPRANVTGQIVQRDNAPVARAVVELVGVARQITGTDGTFRFTGVVPGRLMLLVTALGYHAKEVTLELRADVNLRVELEPDPIALDSVRVRARPLSVRGHVVERGSGRRLPDAVVLLNGAVQTSSSAAGTFRLESVFPGDHILVRVELVGYLPAELPLAPEADTVLTFSLEPDSLALQLIARQLAILDDRSASVGYSRLQINRNEIMASLVPTPAHLLAQRLGLDRAPIRCLFIDEQQRRIVKDLEGYALDRIYRMEVFDKGTIVRVYTTHFIEQMLAGRVRLSPIVLVPGTRGSICG
jgi:hypothetical protein